MDGGALTDVDSAASLEAASLETVSTTACAALEELEQVLADAVADARRPATDLHALSAWAERRVAVQARAAVLERRAMDALARAGVGGKDALRGLEQQAPDAAAAVRARVDDVRARLDELKDADRRRTALIARCREIVGRYLGAIDPPVRAYGPGGARASSSEGGSNTVRSSVRRSA